MSALKRLPRELKDLQAAGADKYLITVGDNMLAWTVTIFGPSESAYVGGKFVVNFTFPDNYPFKNPEMKFVTKIFHPSVADDGTVCVDMLKDWAPTLNVKYCLDILVSMLMNPSGILNGEAARLLSSDPSAFNKTAKEYTAKYAKGK